MSSHTHHAPSQPRPRYPTPHPHPHPHNTPPTPTHPVGVGHGVGVGWVGVGVGLGQAERRGLVWLGSPSCLAFQVASVARTPCAMRVANFPPFFCGGSVLERFVCCCRRRCNVLVRMAQC